MIWLWFQVIMFTESYCICIWINMSGTCSSNYTTTYQLCHDLLQASWFSPSVLFQMFSFQWDSNNLFPQLVNLHCNRIVSLSQVYRVLGNKPFIRLFDYGRTFFSQACLLVHNGSILPLPPPKNERTKLLSSYNRIDFHEKFCMKSSGVLAIHCL